MEVWEVASVLGLADPTKRPSTAPADPATWGTDPQAQEALRAMMAAMPKAKPR